MKRLLLILCALTLTGSALAQRTSRTAAESLDEAVRAAAPGDTLLVEPGLYAGPTLEIDRPITLIGQGQPILDGQGARGLMVISSDSVTIQGFVIRNTGTTFMDDRAALRFEGVSGCRVLENTFESVFFGVYLAGSERCLVRGNTFDGTAEREATGGNAIHAWYSRELRIESNRVSGHRDGIYLEFTDDSEVLGNISIDNLRYGLHFMFSDRCNYRGNQFERNDAGVAVMYANDVEMTDNLFSASWGSTSYGLLLKEIRRGRIAGNRFEANAVGLFVESSDDLDFSHNRFTENGWGVRLMADADNNLFEYNHFQGNTFDVATNSRKHSGSQFRRNFWDRYRGFDLDRDGLGDVPFHPVRLFSVIVESHEPALILLRSALVDLLDLIERALPVFTPEVVVDPQPLLVPIAS